MPFTTVLQKTSKTPSTQASRRCLSLFGVCCLTGCLVFPGVVITHEGNSTKGTESLSGERVISGTVEDVRGEDAKVNTGEGQPRYLPMNLREEKGLSL